jgi:tRNA pseudouridine55 synthase
MMNPDSINGVLLVDKGPDMTSHDVVAVARRTLNTKKIGHCGTLDPMATGLLILVIGRATKIQDLLMSEDKEYTGTLELGKTTNTQDAAGKVEIEREVPPLTDAEITAAFEKYRGDFYQIPPMVSAIKMDGVPLYKLARQGKEVVREPRFVHVYNYRIDGIRLPEIAFTVKCSKGFYVRTYAYDIGETLGCGAHLKSLRRTRSGKFDLERSVTFDELKHGDPDAVFAKMLTLPEVSRLRGA